MLNLSKSIARSELFCSRHWNGKDYLVQFYTFLAVLCVVLSVTATLENLVILVALQNIQHMCDHDFLWCISGETDLHCSGQTPRPVIRDNIWASCNCQQNSHGRPFYVDEKKLCLGLLYLWNTISYLLPSAVLITLELIISTYSYSGIFRTIRRQQIQLRDELEGKRAGTSPNMTR